MDIEAIILERKLKIVTQLIYAGFPILLFHSLEHGQCSCKSRKCTKPGRHPLVPRDKGSRDLETIGWRLIHTPKAGIGYIRIVPEFVPDKPRLVYFRTVIDIIPDTVWAIADTADDPIQAMSRRETEPQPNPRRTRSASLTTGGTSVCMALSQGASLIRSQQEGEHEM